jgi:hypothetical protein
MLKVLWEPAEAEHVFQQAAAVLNEVTGGNLDRDNVRTEAITDAIIAKLRPKPTAPVDAATAA